MNLREWARATHQALVNEPPHQRSKDLSAVDVERVVRMSINTLIQGLVAGDDLRIDGLGRIWCEERPPRRIVSNLNRVRRERMLKSRRIARFRASSALERELNSG